MLKYIHIIPNDPAVNPTPTKNPNSNKSLEPGGIDVNSIASGIIMPLKVRLQEPFLVV